MPPFTITDLSPLVSKTKKNRNPLWSNANLGKTAELPLGNDTGSRLEHTQNHILNYRLNGPCHFSPTPMTGSPSDYDGILYIPVSMPPTRTASDRSLALILYVNGPYTFTGAESHIKWRQTFGSGAWTTLFAETYAAPAGPFGYMHYVLTYTPPSGTGANSLKCIEIKIQNLVVVMAAAYHLPLMHLDSDQYLDSPGDCGPGRYICDRTSSFKGLVDAVGTGADDVESMERLTRRVFFNQSHVMGSKITGLEALGHTNMLSDMLFGPRCRNLVGDDASVYCTPCAVIECTGQDDIAEIELQFLSKVSNDSWTYTVQAGDALSTPLFVHPWSGAGSSSTNGILVTSSADDSIEINAHLVNVPEHGMGTLTLRAWALFEGAAWS